MCVCMFCATLMYFPPLTLPSLCELLRLRLNTPHFFTPLDTARRQAVSCLLSLPSLGYSNPCHAAASLRLMLPVIILYFKTFTATVCPPFAKLDVVPPRREFNKSSFQSSASIYCLRYPAKYLPMHYTMRP